MYRYIAFGWNTADSEKADIVSRLTRRLLSDSLGWQRVLDVPGFCVLHAIQPQGVCRAYVLPRDQGVVLGKLFETDGTGGEAGHELTFADADSERIIESQGQYLAEHYWGYYIAFLRKAGGRVRFVLRDPTGGLPCYITKSFGVEITLSNIEDCVTLGLPSFSIDWGHLVAFFQHSRLVSRTTGFEGVTQLHAGERMCVEDNGATTKTSRSFYWHPVRVYKARKIEDLDEARVKLRAEVQRCVSAWASSYDSIVLQLSGGLDSSIVAASIAGRGARPSVVCLNYFTEMSEGDERSYARAVAQAAGFELIETALRVSERRLGESSGPIRVATPALLGFHLSAEQLKYRLVAERHAGAVFTGQGGDHLFHQVLTPLTAAEYAHLHGVTLHLFRIMRDTTRLTGHSIWSVCRSVLRYGLLRHSFDPYKRFEPPSLLTDDASAMLNPAANVHPWVLDAIGLPSSKIRQIFDIIDCQRFFRAVYPNAEEVHPLISQPIIECCLQVPTYVLTHRGRSRGLVREAFEGIVPTKVINRQSKGFTTGYAGQTVMKNAAYLRELLLDGVLVTEGLLDRHRLEKALSERELVLGKGMRPIMSALMAETWLSTWDDVRQRTAA